jgi:predicted O-linked N-acetylglucosamine transferase (SPINDLY family)
MGVPVVTLEGHNFVSRMGASFLRTLGRPDWVAASEAGYVATAVALARERRALRAGRAALRAQMLASPVSDIDAYTSHFESVLRGMWQSWCEGDGRRLLPASEAAVLSEKLAPGAIGPQ